MPVDIKWDDPSQRVIRVEFAGAWTLSEYQAAQQQALTMATFRGQPCDLIVRIQASSRMPSGGMVMIQDTLFESLSSGAYGHLAVVVQSSQAELIMATMLRAIPVQVRACVSLVTSLEDARQHLHAKQS